MRRAFTLHELLVSIVVVIVLVAILMPAFGRMRGSAGESVSINNLQTLSFAHALYAWDWNDRQLTWVPDDAGVYTVQTGQANWFLAYTQGGGGCPKSLLLGWEDEASPTLWGYFLPCGGSPGTAGNASVLTPISFGAGGGFGFGAFRLANAEAFHNYVDGRFYSETFFTPTDTKSWELASYGFPLEATFTIPPPLGTGGLPQIVNSSYCLSPAAMWGPEVLSYNEESGLWYTAPWTSTTGYQSPTVSQCTYPDLKTRMIEHNWNVGQPAATNPAFAGGNTPYFFNHGLAASPVTLFFDGHVATLANAQVVADDATVLAGTGGAVGLWTRDTPFGSDGYYGAQSFDGTLVSHHVLTAEGILGRDVLNTSPPAALQDPPHGDRGAKRRLPWRSPAANESTQVRPPGIVPTGVPW